MTLVTLPRLDYPNHMADRLNVLSAIIKTRSRADLTDANRVLETITTFFFNALFGWKLKDLNLEQRNHPAVDLGDRRRRVAIQVTNQEGAGKIRDVERMAAKYKLGRRYRRLIVFFLLPKKPAFGKPTRLRGGPKIETWDNRDLLMEMRGLKLAALKRAAAVLDEEMDGLGVPQRIFPEKRLEGPRLLARFQEENGKLCRVRRKRKREKDPYPSYWMDLWVQGAPALTESVNFEILDEGVKDNPWTIRRAKGSIRAQRFLTDDMNLWGDVAILAQGCGKDGTELWYLETTIYQALVGFYGKRPQDPKIEPVLKQFLEN